MARAFLKFLVRGYWREDSPGFMAAMAAMFMLAGSIAGMPLAVPALTILAEPGKGLVSAGAERHGAHRKGLGADRAPNRARHRRRHPAGGRRKALQGQGNQKGPDPHPGGPAGPHAQGAVGERPDLRAEPHTGRQGCTAPPPAYSQGAICPCAGRSSSEGKRSEEPPT